MTVKMYYSARWNTPKEGTWSGTTWHLRKALSERFDVVDFEILDPGPLGKIGRHLRERVGFDDMGLAAMRRNSRLFWRSMDPQPGDVVFSFDECPMADKLRGVLHYVYQDNCVEYVYHAVAGHDSVEGYLGLPKASLLSIEKRLQNQRAFYERAAGVFTMGHWLADYLINECGLPEGKVHPVGGGSNLPYSGRNVHSFDPDAPVYLFVGRDFQRKGGPDVLEAFSAVRRELPKSRLLIAGPAAEPRGTDDVGAEWLGDCSNERVGELLDAADVFVMPSHFEAYGIVFGEALSRGVPCVGRDVCEMPYFIHDGENGVLVHSDDSQELAQAMLRCASNEHIRRTSELESADAAKVYSWDAVASRIADVITRDWENFTAESKHPGC